MNILITLNAYRYNRGSEALVSGLASICKRYDSKCEITVSSGLEGEKLKKILNVDRIVPRKRNIDSKDNYEIFFPLIEAAKDADIVFVVGADNYDASYGLQKTMYDINTCVLEAAKGKVIMYDCSIGLDDLTDNIVGDLKRFTYITARETFSYDALVSKLKNVELLPDPAFLLEARKIELPEVFKKQVGVVAINLSDLILNGYGTNRDVLISGYVASVEYILSNTYLNVILLPHVMGGADLSALKLIYRHFYDEKRVGLFENENASANELKYIISKCDFLITARTHAAIAGYSSYVPTLAIGYSIKAFGIANDIFGTSENYVIHSKDIKQKDDLINKIEWLTSNKIEIREYLKKRMEGYIKSAEATLSIICKVR